MQNIENLDLIDFKDIKYQQNPVIKISTEDSINYKFTENDILNFPEIENFSIKIVYFKNASIYSYNDKTGLFISSSPLIEFQTNNERIGSVDHYVNDPINVIAEFNISQIPLGDSPSSPFDDLDQGYRVIIFEFENFVYFIFGDEHDATEFDRYGKVKKEKYIEQWQAVIDLAKDIKTNKLDLYEYFNQPKFKGGKLSVL